MLDDDQAITALQQALLEDQGYWVTATNSFPDFLDALERGQPDLLLLDLVMPEVDGVRVMR